MATRRRMSRRTAARPGPAAYYDALAPYYRLLYRDWAASVERQARVLDGVIRKFFGPERREVLDAACGIGTQAIGLAGLGYQMTGSDISKAALRLARRDSKARELKINFRCADMRRLHAAHRREFDVVMACDNAVPHLPDDVQILAAFREFHRCTRPGGGCIVSVRDYAAMDLGRSGTHFNPRLMRATARGRVAIFDVWELDGDHYDMATYFVEDRGGRSARTRVARDGRYYRVGIPTLVRLLRRAGFRRAAVLRDRFFQPLVVGVH